MKKAITCLLIIASATIGFFGEAAAQTADTITVAIDQNFPAVPPSVAVPIRVLNIPASENITSFDIKLQYDSSRVKPTVSPATAGTGTLQPNLSIQSSDSSGAYILISAAVTQTGGTTSTISASGILCYLNFTIAPGDTFTTPLTLISALFNESNIPVVLNSGSVSVGNLRPYFTNIPIPLASRNGTQGQLFTYDYNGADPDAGDIIGFYMFAGPPTMQMNQGTGVLTWTPNAQEVGAANPLTQFVTVEIRDDKGMFNRHVDTLSIANVNDPPRFHPVVLPPALEGVDYFTQNPSVFSAFDIDGDPVTFTIQSVSPPPSAGSAFAATGASFHWIPQQADVGTHFITVRASDNKGANADTSLNLVILGTNEPPVFVTNPPAAFALPEQVVNWELPPSQTIVSGQPFTLTVNATVLAPPVAPYVYQFQAQDPDNDPLQFEIFPAPPGMQILDPTATGGRIEWLPSNTGSSGLITLSAKDPSNAQNSQSWSVAVTGAVSWNLGNLSYSVAPFPPGPGATFDPATRTLNWPAPVAGTYLLTFTLTDGTKSATRIFNLTVGAPAPQILASFVSDITGTTAKIIWETNIPVTGSVQYGTTAALGNIANGPAVPAQKDSVILSNLLAGTQYSYQVSVLSAGGSPVLGPIQNFTTFGTPVVNAPPVLKNIPDQTIVLGTPFSLDAATTDPDNDLITYSLDGPPPGMAISAAGLISWPAASVVAGVHPVRVRYTDLRQAVALDTFQLTVSSSAANLPPNVPSVPPVTITAGIPFSQIIAATDPNGDVVTYSIVPGAGVPAGLAINAATGMLTWPVPVTGVYSVTLRFTDPGNLFSSVIFQLTVTPGQVVSPQIIAFFVSDITGTSAKIIWETNTPVTGLVQFGTSPALGNIINGLPVPSQRDSVVLLNLLPGTQYSYQVSVLAPTGGAPVLSPIQSFTTFGTPVVNAPPLLKNIPDQTIVLGTPFSLNAATTDPENDPITYSLDGPPAGMTISAAGLISWPSANVILGIHQVQVRYTDLRQAVAVDTFQLTVSGAAANLPPNVPSVPPIAIGAGIPFSQIIATTDPNGDVVAYSIVPGTGAPTGLAINAATGLLTWLNPVTGVYSITLRFTDPGNAFSSVTFQLTVAPPANRPPQARTLADISIPAGKPFTRDVSTTDPDGDPVTYRLITPPPGMNVSAAGILDWAAPIQAAAPYAIVIEYTDTKSAPIQSRFLLTVLAPENRPPVFGAMPDTIVTSEGTPFSLPVVATDPDVGQVLRYTLAVFPPGMTINESTGIISWPAPVPPFYEVVARVSDGSGGVAQRRFMVRVQSVNLPPFFEPFPPTVFIPSGQPLSASIKARDPNPADVLSYRLVSGPTGIIVGAASGSVNWQNPIAGQHTVTIEVSDGKGGTARAVVQVNVTAPKPVVAGISPAQGPSNQPTPVSIFGDLFAANAAVFVGATPLTNVVQTGPKNINATVPAGLAEGIYNVVVRNSDGGSDTLRSGYTVKAVQADILPPVIFQGPDVVGITQTAATIVWSVNEPATGFVDFGTDSITVARVQGGTGLKPTHQILLSNILPGTRYFYRVGNTDAAGNGPALSGYRSFQTPQVADTQPPVFTVRPSVLNVTDVQAAIGWKTNENATSEVRYRRIGAPDTTYIPVIKPDLILDHVVELFGLQGLSQYEFRVISRDGAGNEAALYGGTFNTKSAPDNTPPQIVRTPGAVGITVNSAVIEWELNEPASGYVEFGTTASYGSISGDSTRKSVHRVFLGNLSGDTPYFFRVRSTDGSGNVFIGIQRSFRTLAARDILAPNLTKTPASEAITDNSARIIWETDEISTSAVRFGADSANLSETGDPALTTRHSIYLGGLAGNTQYFFRVFSADQNGNLFTGKLRSFRTTAAADTRRPVFVSPPAAQGITTEGAIIKWSTDEISDSFVEFAPVDTALNRLRTGRPDLVKEHSEALVSLLPGTRYRFIIYSTDGSGNMAADSGAGNIFRTAEARDIEAPRLSNVPQAAGITENTATVRWEVNEIADGVVEYGTTEQMGRQFTDPVVSKAHSVFMTGLAANQAYFFRVTSTDPSGNRFVDRIRTFKTSAVVDSVAPQLIEQPIVQGITTENAFIRLKTNELSTVEVSHRPAGGTEFVISALAVQATEHNVPLTGLQPSTEYEYLLEMTDGVGNERSIVQPSFRFKTLAQQDIDPPVRVAGPAIVDLSDQSATIAWETNEISTSFVEFGVDSPLTGKTGDPALVRKHSVQITNLLGGVIYKYRILSEDGSRNMLIGRIREFTTKAAADTTPPVIIEGPFVKGLTGNSASVLWRTNENSTSFVSLRKGDETDFRDNGSGELVLAHLAQLFGLEPGVDYFYEVTSIDGSGNERKSALLSFRTPAVVDTTAPVILTGPYASKTSEQSATIEWTTDKLSDSQVNFGEGAALDLSQGDPSRTTEHRVVLSNLLPGRTYGYAVRSVGVNGKSVESDPESFNTRATADILPPVVTNGPVVIGKSQERATIQWRTDEPSDSRINFGISSTYTDFVEEESRVKEHVLHLTGLLPGQEYHYQVVSEDNFNNEFVSTDYVFRTNEGRDTKPPVLTSGPVVIAKSATNAAIEWETDEPSGSQVDYQPNDTTGRFENVTDGSNVKRHSMRLTNLTPGTRYVFKVRSKDPDNNEFFSAIQSFTTDAERDASPPILVAGPIEIGKTESQVTIRWTLNESADGFLEYGTTSAYGERTGTPDYQVEHRVQLTNLVAGQEYHYRLISQDQARNKFESTDFTFRTLTGRDEQAPVVVKGPIVSDRGVSTATIEWVTDEVSSTKLNYGLTESLSEAAEFSDFVSSHRVDLTNLFPDTTYYFRISSTDPSRNTFNGIVRNFRTRQTEDTTPPAWRARANAINRTASTATIWWQTDEPADSYVEFGENAANLDRSVARGERVIDREVLLTGLRSNTDYFYRAISRDAAGNSNTSSILSFRTLGEQDNTPPVILEGPFIGNVTHNSATIKWRTDENASSLVDYGPTPDSLINTNGSADLLTDHEVVLTNLLPDRLYVYRVRSADLNRNEVNTSDRELSFYTKAGEDRLPPDVIEGPAVTNLSLNAATIVWKTNELANAAVEFGTDTLYLLGPAEDLETLTRHLVTLRNLEPGRDYVAYVRSADLAGNVVETRSRPLFFRTHAAADTIPPQVVRGPVVQQVTSNTATIEWETDEQADGFVLYSVKDSVIVTREGSTVLSKVHVVVITNLRPGTNYEFTVSSADIAGNGAEITRRKFEFQTPSETDAAPPVITAGPIVHSTERSASFQWKTDELSDSFVYFKIDSPDVRPEKLGDGAPTRDHSVVVTNLDSSASYIFIVASRDMAGNVVTFPSLIPEGFGTLYKTLGVAKTNQPPGGDGRFRTSRRSDTQRPVIVSGPVVTNKTAATVTVTWKTDELSDSQVDFGTSEQYGKNSVLTEKSTTHTVSLTNLEKATAYNYRIGSTDINFNGPTQSTNSVFTTLGDEDIIPPVITDGPVIGSLTNTQATILWETDEPSNSFVDYSSDPAFFNNDSVPRTTRNVSEYKESHMLTLTNLTAGDTIHYRVRSYDISNNGPAFGPDTFFVTELKADTSAPAVTAAPGATFVSNTQANIHWGTATLANSFVHFDTSAKVGKRMALYKAGKISAEDLFDYTVGDIDYKTDHNVLLTNLSPNTSYSFVAGSIDQFGNQTAAHSIIEFTTAAAADTAPPGIPQNLAAFAGDRAVLLSWDVVPNTAGDLSGYNIYRFTGSEWKPVATNQETNSYYDYGVSNDQFYAYAVTSVDKMQPVNESDRSESAAATPSLLAVPASPLAQSPAMGAVVTSSQVILSVQNAEGGNGTRTYTFAVARDSLFLDLVVYQTKVPEGTGTTSFTATGIGNQELFYWRARANDGHFDGKWTTVGTFSTDYPTAVDLAVFAASAQGNSVRITWETSNEDNNAGFYILRSLTPGDGFQRIGTKMIPASPSHEYSFVDKDVQPGRTYYYRLESVSLDGMIETYDTIQVTLEVPRNFELHQNYPNPFNPLTTVKFELPKSARVTIKIYNILGQEVRTLVNDDFEAGFHVMQWDGTNDAGIKVASGVYIYRMKAGSFVKSMKMMFLK